MKSLPADFASVLSRLDLLEKTLRKLELRISALENRKPFVPPHNRILKVSGESMHGIRIGRIED